MPNIVVRIPDGVLDADSKARLVSHFNGTAAEVERIPDTPRSRSMCWVIVDEVKAGNWTCGGTDVTAQIVPVIVQVFVPAGVLDGEARSRYAAGIFRAVTLALEAEKRQVLVSTMFNDVPDGHWGVNESIWPLEVFARHAGYMHLQHLVSH